MKLHQIRCYLKERKNDIDLFFDSIPMIGDEVFIDGKRYVVACRQHGEVAGEELELNIILERKP